jgi:hypothetical protein
MESVKDRIKREYGVAEKTMAISNADKIKTCRNEEFENARAWIRVAENRGRGLTLREQENLNI